MSNQAEQLEQEEGQQIKARAPWQNALATSRDKFEEINARNKFVNYDTEAMFALQAITKNDYLMKIANNNPASLRNAVINIAAIGLSLNPATKYAYLVPRDNQACLDISYIGLIKLATDTGSIMWARAELVHEKDVFIYHGATEKPEFNAPDPFDRGAIKGVYCVAKTKEGDYLSGIMSIDEINAIMQRSMTGKNGKGPWATDFGEMAKKTIIKRESKTWPKTDKSARFDEAIEVINQHDGIDFDVHPIARAIEKHRDTIDTVVNALADERYEEAAEAYFELTHEEQMSIWIAPTKCEKLGIDPPFTTAERKFIKEELGRYHPERLVSCDDEAE